MSEPIDLESVEVRPPFRLNIWSVLLLLIYDGIPLVSLIAQLRMLHLMTAEQWRIFAGWFFVPPILAGVASLVAFRVWKRSNWAANALFIGVMILAFMARNAALHPQQ